MSGVSVWARARVPPSAVSARQGNSARKALARLVRPLAGPDTTIKIPQRNHLLVRRVPTAHENVVNGVKTIMVNEPLRGGRARRLTGEAMLRRGAGDSPPRWT